MDRTWFEAIYADLDERNRQAEERADRFLEAMRTPPPPRRRLRQPACAAGGHKPVDRGYCGCRAAVTFTMTED